VDFLAAAAGLTIGADGFLEPLAGDLDLPPKVEEFFEP